MDASGGCLKMSKHDVQIFERGTCLGRYSVHVICFGLCLDASEVSDVSVVNILWTSLFSNVF